MDLASTTNCRYLGQPANAPVARERRNGMIDVVGRFADRLLTRLVPRGEASACSDYYLLCYCSGGLRYSKRCGGGCNGIPSYCYSCTTITGTC